eukprot:TRINITY_DN1056_c5_g1_i1.p2 TRINITY_DN1056_c5_g1~~TRINITY_DN1056_c5_g1_i1.p2  ORF type:complete len:103 (+),score=10.43 TRINITY_DN1056_c5_g1_i1:355-663(+)
MGPSPPLPFLTTSPSSDATVAGALQPGRPWHCWWDNGGMDPPKPHSSYPLLEGTMISMGRATEQQDTPLQFLGAVEAYTRWARCGFELTLVVGMPSLDNAVL